MNGPFPQFDTAEDYWKFVAVVFIAYATYQIWLELTHTRSEIGLLRGHLEHQTITVEPVEEESDDE